MLNEAERPVIVAGGGVINADGGGPNRLQGPKRANPDERGPPAQTFVRVQ